jgi:hypothetical protein
MMSHFCASAQAPGTHLLAGRLGGEGGARGGTCGALATLVLSPHLELVGGACARVVGGRAGRRKQRAGWADTASSVAGGGFSCP